MHIGKKYGSTAEIMVNSFVDLELGAFKALKEQGKGIPPVYLVEPTIKTGPVDGFDVNEGLRSLDKQPNRSVLFFLFFLENWNNITRAEAKDTRRPTRRQQPRRTNTKQ